MFTQHGSLRILLVEDNAAEARLLDELLRQVDEPNVQITHVQRLRVALECLTHSEFDVILLDLTLPDSQGLVSVRKLTQCVPHLPVIVLTNLDDEELAIAALREGAQDYLVKRQVTQPLLLRALRYAIERKQILGALNQARDDLELRVQERTVQLAETYQQLCWQASHDSLTGLANRYEFERCLEQAIDDAKNAKNTHVLCYLDLDQFKIVNDTCGHTVGDALLRQISQEFQAQLQKGDLLARLGGDEFGLILYHCTLSQGEKLAEKITQSLRHFQFIWQDKIFKISVSIGLVLIDANSTSQENLLSAADTAMYVAKDQGRNRFHVYHQDDGELAKRWGDMQWVSRITAALEEDRFCLFAQEIRPIQTKVAHQPIYEILLRLKDKAGNLIMPGGFIPAAERYHLMPQLDCWVVQTLFKKLKAGQPLVPGHDPKLFPIYNINLSGASFNDDHFLNFVKQQFLISQISPAHICFEITETTAITHLKTAVHFIEELKQLGCRFALDDFGRGMSSLTYLKTLPVDYLKIDGQLVRPIVNDPIALAMIEAVSHISQVMGLCTIAEFVEDERILQTVKALGIDYGQGYAIGKPAPLLLAESCLPFPEVVKLAS